MEPSTVLPVHHGRAADRCRGCVIKLPPEARSVPTARAHVTQLLQGWGLGEQTEDTALVASELVTNAVRASASGSSRQSCSIRVTCARADGTDRASGGSLITQPRRRSAARP